eukprot:Phypoly_transcript_07243.p1 GENE.Phypoly_transcript_07243~~Phypoly_transcript_07243.p1  ORF type:complete len:494 (+),score=99.40 Phypoly_transcript_07243:183-1664(+)
MALFVTNAKCMYITLFIVIVLVVGIGQLAYLSPTKALANIRNENEIEIVQLRLENSGLREQEQERKEQLEDLREAFTQITEEKQLVQTQLNKLQEEKQQTDTQLSKIKEEKDLLQQKMEQLQTPDGDKKDGAQVDTSGLDQKILDMLNAPKNVITNKDTLLYLLDNFNKYGAIRNEKKFTLDKDFIPIVIRVYNKHEYFGWALENYKKVQNINKTMMIISHDGIFPEMFKLVQSIDFCQVKQIIHPFSGHFLMNRFPGPDKSIPDHRDQYGNPRPFPHIALKHHFWWHLNYVWDQFLPDHPGDMVFMEEDHVPTTDYYPTIKALRAIRNEKCSDCFNAKIHQHGHSNPGIHDVYLTHELGNVGMIFSRERWIQLRGAGKEFCTFDDYNWDWTMGHLTAIKAIAPLSLTCAFPRAEHMGKCGTHESSGVCEITAEDKQHFNEVNEKLKVDGGNWEHYNFNPNPIDGPKQRFNGWGGWAHPWDHEHCMNQIKKDT